MRKTMLALAALALALTATMGPASATEAMRGFNGHLVGQATFVPTTDPTCTAPPLQTVSTGTGQASQLGPVTMSALHCSGDHIAGLMTLGGMFGEVTISYEGDCTPYVPGVELVQCHLPFTVTGGTDRYEGATGTGHMVATVVPQPPPEPWPAEWTWKGRISY
jgi:hypothetical protein